MPELPEAAKSRLQDDYNLDAYTASVIASDPPAIRIFDEAVKAANDSLIASDNTTSEVSLKDVPTTIANLLCNELFSLIREDEEERRSDEIESFDTKDVPYSTVDGQQLGEIVALQLNGTMSATMSKKLVGILYHEEHGRRPSQVAQERGLQLISDMEALRNICRDIIDLNPESLEVSRGKIYGSQSWKCSSGTFARCSGGRIGRIGAWCWINNNVKQHMNNAAKM